MKIDKIDVQTLDSKHATDIGMLVDKLEFIQEINKLRVKWQITKLYTPSQFNIFLELNVMTNNGVVAEDFEIQKRLTEFKKDIAGILKKFNRDKNFKPVVEYALATGIVPNGIYRSCYFDVVTIGEPDNLETPERYRHVIVLSQRTELEEVKAAYNEFKEHIEGKRKFESRKTSEKSTLTETEIDESNELVKLITSQHDIYMANLQEDITVADFGREYIKFIKNTKPMRDKLNLLIAKTSLNSETPSDMDLIEDYHKGIIYPYEFNTLEKIHRARDWYWSAYYDVINGIAKKRKSSKYILDEWHLKCPVKQEHATVEELSNCPHCSITAEDDVDHSLSTYSRLLKLS